MADRRWAIGCAGIFLLVGASVLAIRNLPGWMYECEYQTVAAVPSPDGVWSAVARQEVCGTITPASTSVVYFVHLVRKDEKLVRDNAVLILDEEQFRLDWLSAQKLQIIAPVYSYIPLEKADYQGIEVVLKFDPDDPVERVRVLKQQGGLPD